jgi:AraC-like DNA-binding protein
VSWNTDPAGSAGYELTELRPDLADTDGSIRRPPDAGYRFLVPTTGETTVRQSGRRLGLTPGTGALLTLAEPLEAAQTAGARSLVLTIPAHQLNAPTGAPLPPVGRLDLRTGLGRIVADLLQGLDRERGTLTVSQFDASCDRLTELLRMLAPRRGHPSSPAHLAEVSALVRRHIRAHAADHDLTGATIAQDLGWSLRQIQLALQHDGATPRELIREERLRLVRRLLQDPAYAHLPITDLAYASGFSSPSALSTAFRHRYKTTPRETRRQATDPGVPAQGPGF